MKKFTEILMSGLLGIAVALSLVFVLGGEWYKLIPFSLLGITSGLIFYDAAGFFGVISTALKSARLTITNLAIFNVKLKRKRSLDKRMTSCANAYAPLFPFFLGLITMAIQVLLTVIMKKPTLIYESGYSIAGTYGFTLLIDVAIASIIYFFLFSFDLFYKFDLPVFEIWSQELPFKWQLKIWGKRLEKNDKAENFGDKSWPEMRKAIFRTVIRMQLATGARRISNLFGFLAMAPVFLVTLLIQTSVFILLFGGLFFKELTRGLNRSKAWRLITAMVIIGTLVGAWQHSYLWGFGSGAVVVALGFITNWVDKKIIEIRLTNYFESRAYFSARRSIRRTFFFDNRPIPD